MKKIFVLLALVSGAAIAAPQNANIPLGDLTVNPHSTSSLSLTPLIAGAVYDVTCQISPGASNIWIGLDYSNPSSPQYAGITINGTKVHQVEIHSSVIYKAIGVGNSDSIIPSALTFSNLDDTNSFKVNGCIASPHPYLSKK